MPTKLLVPAPSEIRDSLLRVERSELIARGVANPNVTKGSDSWVRAEALAQQVSILYANQQVLADRTMPDSSEDDDLIRIAAMFGIALSDAVPSAGNIVLNASASTSVLVDAQLIDSSGQFFKVTVGATYAPGDSIPIIGISTGKATNHPQGTVLQWISAPAFSAATALVGVGGLIGGADTDSNESLRNKLFTLFRNPPGGGNWSMVVALARAASASVVAAYVYPALNGPGTLGLSVLGAPSYDPTTKWSRAVSAPVLATVTSYVASHMPEGISILTTTPTDGGATPDVDSSVSIGMSLPLSVAAGGTGGGWVDAQPWPTLLGTSTRCTVSAVTSGTVFTLTSDDSGTTPSANGLVDGDTTIAWFSSANYAAGLDPLVIATVVSHSGTTGAIQVTISTAFTGIASGDYVMPNAEKIQDYARAWLTAMGDMGPGQWTNHAQVLVRGKRRPYVTASNPSDFTSTQLRALSSAGDEVRDVQYLSRVLTTPGIPANTTTASPNIFVPSKFGIYDRIP